uniref:Glycosyltransferase 61 catalytic domain-containing protein n=1 Tax=Pyramimonas obovata TaxID=1411642 RepID=A0A6T7WMI2_9CHLO|mmetsp:Transcript_26188/g.56806  ORF Transcript_26188/g.56806 Transcript_26188/m.56806 type:complete len:452 (+) Transcript_26188:371-1726(+)
MLRLLWLIVSLVAILVLKEVSAERPVSMVVQNRNVTMYPYLKKFRNRPYPVSVFRNICTRRDSYGLTTVYVSSLDQTQSGLVETHIKEVMDAQVLSLHPDAFFSTIWSKSRTLTEGTLLFKGLNVSHVGHFFHDQVAPHGVVLNDLDAFDVFSKPVKNVLIVDGPSSMEYLTDSTLTQLDICRNSSLASELRISNLDTFKLCHMYFTLRTIPRNTPNGELQIVYLPTQPSVVCVEELIVVGKDRLLVGTRSGGASKFLRKFRSEMKRALGDGATSGKGSLVYYDRRDNLYRQSNGTRLRNRSARYVVNTEQVASLLSVVARKLKIEFVKVNMTSLSYLQQFTAFNDARVVVTPEGAHLTAWTMVLSSNADLYVMYGHCRGQVKQECPDVACFGGGIGVPKNLWIRAAITTFSLNLHTLSFCREGSHSHYDERFVVNLKTLRRVLPRTVKNT